MENGGSVLFDGNNDGLAFEKVADLDRPESFSIAFWFKRNNEMLGIPTNHQIDNLMVAQSSSYDNDNWKLVVKGVKLKSTWIQVEVMKTLHIERMVQILVMITGITW